MTGKILSTNGQPLKNVSHKKSQDTKQEISRQLNELKTDTPIIINLDSEPNQIDHSEIIDVEFNDEHYPIGHEHLELKNQFDQLDFYDRMILSHILAQKDDSLNATLIWCVRTYGVNEVDYQALLNTWKESEYGPRNEQWFPTRTKIQVDEPIEEEASASDLEIEPAPEISRPNRKLRVEIMEPTPIAQIPKFSKESELKEKAASPNARQSHGLILKSMAAKNRCDVRDIISSQQLVMKTGSQQFDVKPENRSNGVESITPRKALTMSDWLVTKEEAPNKLSPLKKYKMHHREGTYVPCPKSRRQWQSFYKESGAKEDVAHEQSKLHTSAKIR